MKPAELTNVDRIAIELGHAGRNAIPYIDDDRNADRPFAADLPPLLHARPPGRDRAARRAAQRRRIPRLLGAGRRQAQAADRGADLLQRDLARRRKLQQWPRVLGRRQSAPHRRLDLRAGGQRGARPDRRRDHRWPERVPVRPFRRRPVRAPADEQPVACAVQAVAAGNPGWYTLPTFDHPFPEGMARRPDRGSPGQAAGLSHDHPGRRPGHRHRRSQLPSEPAAMRQGPHRFARAQNYFEAGRKEAEPRRAVQLDAAGRPASATTAAPCRRSAPASGSMAACPTTPSWPAWPASRSPDRSLSA